MIVPSLVYSTGKTIESIQIKLTLEARHLGLLEVLRHDVPDKLLRLVYQEASPVRLPRYHVRISISLNGIEHGVKFDGEGNDYASLGLVLD
jgi:hypothetical protein